MKNFRKLLCATGAVALLFGMASCQNGKETSKTSETTSTTTTTTTTTQDNYKMKLMAPQGAPGISVVDLEVNATDKYEVSTGNTGPQVKAALAANQMDAIVAPFNFGLDEYNANKTYQLAGVVTWGNLYLASWSNFTLSDVTAENTILFGQKSIPGMVTSYVLGEKNHTVATDFQYLADGAATAAQLQLEANKNKIYLVPEPALTGTKAAIKKNFSVDITIVSVQEAYKEVTGQDLFPQAALFVRKETVKNHKAVVDAFIKDVKNSCDKTATDAATIAGYAVDKGLHKNATVLASAMPRCAIQFVSALDSKTSINAFVTPVLGGVNPEDGFYYS